MDDILMTEEELAEYVKCAQSPEYFIENFCWLQQKASAGVSTANSIIPFAMGKREGDDFYFQREIVRHLHLRENVLVKKSRRVGCSWIAAAYAAWLINFHENVTVNFISQNGKKAKDILRKVKFILNNLAYHDHKDIKKATPAKFLLGEVETMNQERIAIVWRNDDGSISTHSEVVSLNNTDNSSRGDDPTLIVFDELAFYEHPDDTWASAIPGLTRGGHWFGISTPNGVGHVYHRMTSIGDLWAENKITEKPDFWYRRIYFHEAGITEAQIRKSTVGMTQDLIDQEWHLKDLVPGSVAFNPAMLAACYKPISQFPDIGEYLDTYRTKVSGMNDQWMYASGADTAGILHRKTNDHDYNSFTAMTLDGVQAFAYHGRDSLSEWCGSAGVDGKGKVSQFHEQYRGPLNIEVTGPGYTTYVNHIAPDDVVSEYYSVEMKHKKKKGIIERLILRVENMLITITDPFTYQCMQVFQKGFNPGEYSAPQGYFDDPVMSLALACDLLDKLIERDFDFGGASKDVVAPAQIDLTIGAAMTDTMYPGLELPPLEDELEPLPERWL